MVAESEMMTFDGDSSYFHNSIAYSAFKYFVGKLVHKRCLVEPYLAAIRNHR